MWPTDPSEPEAFMTSDARAATVKRRTVAILVIAEVLAMSLWFVSSAVLVDLRAELALSSAAAALLASSVPAGFVVGALLIAFSGLADRLDPRRVFAVAAVLAAALNAAFALLPPGGTGSIVVRFLTGFALAGVYPVGMKIVVGWGTRDRGWLVGLVVGGLTLGSAAPHLLAFLGGNDWRQATLIASGLALVAAALATMTRLGPHHAVQPRLAPGAIAIAWTDMRIRRAYLGYFGHMWELYAMWSWIGPALAVSYARQMDEASAVSLSKLTAFVAIAAGALLCPPAGWLADRIGKASLTILMMTASGLSAVLAGLVFGGPVWLVAGVVVVWGATVIPDSAQFSALVADYSPPALAGSLMSLQTAIGFALTILTVQTAPLVADVFGWPVLFWILSLGPLLGIVSMRALR